LKGLIDEAIVLTKPKLNLRHINLKCNYIEHSKIFCNEIEIEQVIVNLINNSIDAISTLTDKWITISVTETKQHYNISITDAGSGISLDKQNTIFEPFVTTKIATGSTGLGLSIVKGILDNHGAKITIDDTNINTSFIINFPKVNKCEKEI
jgi:signal transduction histidine kinase